MSKITPDTNSVPLRTSIGNLIIHLHRGNKGPAEALVNVVWGQLKTIMQSETDPDSFPMRRAQQTMFAIDEVRTLLAQHDLGAALSAARDAGREWGQQPK